MALKRAFLFNSCHNNNNNDDDDEEFKLGTLSTNASSQLDVLWHDSHAFCVNGAQVCVLEQPDQVGLAGFLQGHHGRSLESQIGLEILSDLSNQPLKRQLANQQFSTFLVPADFTQSHSARAVSVRLLHASCGWCTLSRCLSRQLFSRGLSPSRFPSSLLCARHNNNDTSFPSRSRDWTDTSVSPPRADLPSLSLLSSRPAS